MSAEADAAGREASGTPSTLDVEGLGFTLKLKHSKAPFKLLKLIGDHDGSEAKQAVVVFEELLGKEQADKVWDAGLDMDAGRDLMNALLDHYGIGSGESEASPNS